MKIFISHALADQELVLSVKRTLEPHGLRLLIAEHHEDLENTITVKIEKMIISSDAALILLTKNGCKSAFVQQEIGYIKSSNIPYLQVVQKGYEKKIKGFNFGKDYVLLDPKQPTLALDKVKRSLLSYWQQKSKAKKEQELARIKNEHILKEIALKRKNDETAAKFAIGGLATLLVLGLLSGNGD